MRQWTRPDGNWEVMKATSTCARRLEDICSAQEREDDDDDSTMRMRWGYEGRIIVCVPSLSVDYNVIL